MKKYILFLLLSLVIFDAYCETAFQWVSLQEGVTLRETPSLDGNEIDLLPFAEKIEVIEVTKEALIIDNTEGYWCRIMSQNNKIGWVFGGHIVDYYPDLARYYPVINGSYAYYNSDYEDLYITDNSFKIIINHCQGLSIKNGVLKVEKGRIYLYVGNSMANKKPDFILECNSDGELFFSYLTTMSACGPWQGMTLTKGNYPQWPSEWFQDSNVGLE